jgi:hypothetical protein
MVHIKDTLALTKISVSKGYEEKIKENPALRMLDTWKKIKLNKEGNLVSPFAK